MPSDEPLELAPKAPKTWKSTGITGLVFHIPTGTYYHRYSIKGKRTYRSLETGRLPTAKLRLATKSEEVETLRQAREERSDDLRTLGELEGLLLLRIENSNKHPATKRNYGIWLRRLESVWPEYRKAAADRIKSETLHELRRKLQGAKFQKGGAKKLTTGYSAGAVNQTLLVFKMLLDLAQEKRVVVVNPFENSSGALAEKVFLPKTRKKLALPTHAEFEKIFQEMAQAVPHPVEPVRRINEQHALNAAEMARLIAYSGARHEEANATTWEDITGQRIQIHGTKSKTSERIIPIIPPLAKLLGEIKARRIAARQPIKGRILKTQSCLATLRRACLRLGIPKLTQHELRHYFATTCIESGVDIPTVSRWLGHSDGGALCMKTYGHLRDEHSTAAAQKVTFGT